MLRHVRQRSWMLLLITEALTITSSRPKGWDLGFASAPEYSRQTQLEPN
jgi:hypothetical protein